MSSLYRCLPGVDRLLAEKEIKELLEGYPHSLIVESIRNELDRARASIAAGSPPPDTTQIVAAVADNIRSLQGQSLRPVINASGVIIHTNLGRAPLSKEAIAAVETTAKGYCNLEFDLKSGERGSRQVHVEQLLCRITGAEAALVVNNNAAAVLLGLSTIARRKEVIVSRGQSVEIGGGFRVPDVMRQSGAKLIEVGTTNCTYIRDYEQAITPQTAALLRVHSSNFKVVGFIHSVELEEMAALSKKSGIPLLDDAGSGCLIDTAQFGLDPEPMAQQSIALGAGLVFFSGDKLLGGPQAGIIVGRQELVARLKKHPLARATRIDKLDLAALAATLVHYLKGEALSKIPVWRMISTPLPEIERRANLWAESLSRIGRVVEGETMVGGGSLPGGTLPTRLIAIGEESKKKGTGPVQKLSKILREQPVPIIGRISGNLLLLDPRTVLPEEDEALIRELKQAVSSL